MSQHAVLSPSSAHRWMACPASVVLSEGLPRGASSAEADEGTAAHFLAAGCLASRTEQHPAEAHGHTIYVADGVADWADPLDAKVVRRFVVDMDMVTHVNTYVQSVRAYAGGGVLLVEQAVPIGLFTGEDGAEGTADAVIITQDGELQIHDLKYGQGVRVTAAENKQLMLYAVGAVEAYGVAYEFDRVRLVIHQPRIHASPSEWSCSVEELMVFAEEVRLAANRIEQLRERETDRETDFGPSEEACRWCPVKHRPHGCPGLERFVEATVGASLAELSDLSDAPPIPDDPADLGQIKKAADLIKMWIDSVDARVRAELDAGRPVAGWKLVLGREGDRAWADSEQAEATLKSMRLKQDEMYVFKLISPTQAEKLTKGDNPALGNRQWNKLKNLITRSAAKPMVAPAGDPRPAYSPSPDFDGLDEEDLV